MAGSKLRQALYGGSPTVAQCLPLQTCKLPKTARTAQNCAKAWSVCKPAKEQQRRLLHNLPYARAFCPYKATSTQPPLTSYSPVTPPYSSHPSLHTSRESLSCSRSIESQPCGKYSIEGRIESLYAAICLISPCMGSLVRSDVHTPFTQRVCPASYKALELVADHLNPVSELPSVRFTLFISSLLLIALSCHVTLTPQCISSAIFQLFSPNRQGRCVCRLINWQSYQLCITRPLLHNRIN